MLNGFKSKWQKIRFSNKDLAFRLFHAKETTIGHIPELESIKRSVHNHPPTAWHTHSSWQIDCVIRGRLRIEFLDGQQFEVGPGALALTAAQQLHRVFAEPMTVGYLCRIILTQEPQFISSAIPCMPDITQFRGRSLFLSNARPLGKILERINRLWKSPDAVDHLVANAELIRLLNKISQCGGTVIDHVNPARNRDDSQAAFEQAARFIAAHYANPELKNREIAKAVRMSLSSLYKLFAHHCGYGPKEFLRLYRVQMAQDILVHDGSSISAIARMIGFPDVYTFSRVFKRVTGRSPSQFRVMALEYESEQSKVEDRPVPELKIPLPRD